MGASESSLKRWCDQGLIQTQRTAGGHRKIPVSEVVRFVRERQQTLVDPELLGLPRASKRAEQGLERGSELLEQSLLAGNELLARQVVFDLYLARHSISVLCDQVIGRAFQRIGERWACHEAAVYQERRACEIALRILLDLRRSLPRADTTWIAMGGTLEGDHYVLPSVMVELVLREAGWAATSLGNSIPCSSLLRAVNENQVALFWLSVSHIQAHLPFLTEFAALSAAASARGTALVVGGQALTHDLRQGMTYSSFCDTMQQLSQFALTLRSATQQGFARGQQETAAAKLGGAAPG